MTTFKTIATHLQPHLDEIAGIWMLVKFGEGLFPGINNALVEFWDKMPEGKTAAGLETEGVVCVGIGGGRFDEHPSANNGRKQDDCAVTLIAKELNFIDDPAMKPLLEFVRMRDLKLTGSAFDLHALVKTLYNAGRSDEAVWNWVFEILGAIYQQQLGFFEGAGTDFMRARVRDIRIGNLRGEVKNTKMAVGVSDSREFAKYARSPHGCSAGIVIQQTSSGNVQIQTKDRLEINLTDVVRMIRIEENKARARQVPEDWKYLETERSLPVCEEWHYFLDGKMLLNGSTTADKQPTRLSLVKIEELVQIGVDPRAFEPAHRTMCEQGVCTSSPQRPCQWYGWGLQRCRKVRFQAHQKKSSGGSHSVAASK